MTDFDLVLHVGIPRSGPLIRRSLRYLRPQLHAHGVAFLGGPDIEKLPHAKGWDTQPETARAAAPAFAREVAAAVAAERGRARGLLGRRPVQTVVSSDRLLGFGPIGRRDAQQFRPYAANAVGHVIRALSARRVQVVLYTQRQDRLMELSYLHRVQGGELHSFEEQFPYQFEPVLDYLDLADRLGAVAQVAEVVVRPVELVDAGTHAFVNDFLSLLGLDDTLDLYAIGPDVSPHPTVLSGKGAHVALAMTPLMETPDEVRLVRNYVASNFPTGERYTTDFVDRAARERILETYAARNRALFEQYLPKLPADSYGDDTATFALGNVLAQPARPPAPTGLARTAAAAAEKVVNARISLERRARPLARRVRDEFRRRRRSA